MAGPYLTLSLSINLSLAIVKEKVVLLHYQQSLCNLTFNLNQTVPQGTSKTSF